ncbi:hypothetical protein ABTX35_19290, partial [Streptomyces sp. NPDC096080]|uniref:hypothetical protein n=1 Tax=Streptomyces sp. NPDC096080 TaxID=3156693 RepID=UPI003325620B
MSAVAHAHAEPHTAAGGARVRGGGAGPVAGRALSRRPQRRDVQMIDIPERVYRGSHYSDAFVKAWAKMAALDTDNNEEHCNAHVAEMARFCGLSKRRFEYALAEGHAPGPDGGLPEFTTRRMTRRGGTGRTAIRTVRPVLASERHIRVPMTMCDALEPRRLRAALLIQHRLKYLPGHEPTALELAGELFHHDGKNAGKHLTERTARTIINDLEATGWLDVGRRTGFQGRNTLTPRPHPLRAPAADTGDQTATAPAPRLEHDGPLVPVASAENDGGSGPADHGGSLAIKEDTSLSTDVVTQTGGGIRRRRTSGTGPAPVDNRVPDTFGQGALRADTSAGRPATSQQQRLGAREWDAVRAVLAPVAHEVSALTGWEQRRAAREIVRQLEADGATVERLADRIERRYARTTAITSFPRWLIGAALTRHGCGDPRCETGTIWETGLDCELCAVNHQTRTARAQRERDLEAAEQRTRTGRGVGGRDEDAFREAVREQERQRRDAGRERARLLAELAARGEVLPRSAVFGPGTVPDIGAEPEPLPVPVKKTYRERSAAPEGEIRAAIRALGPAYALHVYGALRALPLINAAAEQASCGVGGPGLGPEMPAPSRIREQADQARTGMRLRPASGDIAAPCPTCRAPAGQPCTTP